MTDMEDTGILVLHGVSELDGSGIKLWKSEIDMTNFGTIEDGRGS